MSKRVLAVDDHEPTLKGLAELLSSAGYEVHSACTFDSAKRALLNERPEILLVDIRLGEYNGLQLISMIAAQPVRIPAIVLSGFDDPVLRADAAAFGAPYLLKPVDPSMLLDTVAEQLRQHAVPHETVG